MIRLIRGTATIHLADGSAGGALVLPAGWCDWLFQALDDPLVADRVRHAAVGRTGGRTQASDDDVMRHLVGLLEAWDLSLVQPIPKPIKVTGGGASKAAAPAKRAPIKRAPPPPKRAPPPPPPDSSTPAAAFKAASDNGAPLVCKGPCAACGHI